MSKVPEPRVTPHRYHADKPNAFADRFSMSVRGDQLVVSDLRNREYVFPLARKHFQADAVASLVVTRARDADKAGTGIEERLELVSADRKTLCVVPMFQWDEGELQAFCHEAGLRWEVTDVFRNLSARDKAFPRVKGAPVLSTMTRVGGCLWGLALTAAVLLVGLLLFVVF